MKDNDVPPQSSESNEFLGELKDDDSILKREIQIEKDIIKKESQEDDSESGVEWDGSEAEIVIDDDAEEYEGNVTGIKLKYSLEDDEVYDSIKHSGMYQRSRKLQRNHTIVQAILILFFLIFSIVTGKSFYALISLIPIISIIGIWVLPSLSMKRMSKELFLDKDFSVEIFPDHIDVDFDGINHEIALDGSYYYQEHGDIMIISSKKGSTLMIPVRCVEPEFLPDVQAMIVAGTRPKK